MCARFKGRSLSVINDLNVEEQIFLYQKTRELKEAHKEGRGLDAFRLKNPEASFYLLFMEDSTRTKESFRNAAAFHGGRVNLFDAAASSFNKMESISDTVKMLVGYAPSSTFIIRSRLEGLTAFLDDTLGEYCVHHGIEKPVFINAGDGKHEHPTQELLDEFSFLEQKNWDRSSIHLAIVGDLFHGRTVHSKVNGLRIFDSVRVDLIAPKELMMPEHYIDEMKSNGFSLRIFASIEEYLTQDDTAGIWYFTRLQLERMGDEVLEKAGQLRKAVTFRREFMPLLKPGTRFYHPLPRHKEHPTVPTFLDNTALNGWDAQSVNGYFTRIIEIGLLNGLYDGEAEKSLPPVCANPAPSSSFVKEMPLNPEPKISDRKVGIKPVENGIVIDHISCGPSIETIWNNIDRIRKVLHLNVRSSHGVYHRNDPNFYKGIISLPDILSFSQKEVKKLAAVSPGCTINFIKDSRVYKKLRLDMPPRVYGFSEISCKNEACVSHASHHESVMTEFLRAGEQTFKCKYCEKPFHYDEIWDL